jgi:archaeosine synthase
MVEVYLIKRDGWARICQMKVENHDITTPAVISLDGKKSLLGKIDFDLVPYSLKALNEEKFNKLYQEDRNFIVGTGLSVLSPPELVKYLIELRKKSITKPFIVTGIATPQNLPILCYYGVDLVDDSRVVMAAYEGYYLLETGSFLVEKLKELPCSCKACERVRANFPNLKREEKVDFLKEHNTLKLQEQARLLREIIRSETLRNYIEVRAKTSPELTVMLRKADETDFFERMYPRFKRSIVYMNTMESFKRPEVGYFLKRIAEVYKPQTKTALLLPCTARKPYSLSKTHRKVLNSIGKLVSFVDEIIISSPLVCPREFELTYPAQNYDTPVTGVWSGEEIDFVAENLLNLLIGFEKIIAHVEGGYRKVVEKVEKEIEGEVIYTSENGVTSKKSIKNLREKLEEVRIETRDRKDRYLAIFNSMFRYQFGLELKEFIKGGKVRGRYPNLELYLKERVLRIDNLYGMLDVDLGLAEDLVKKKMNLVEIGEFEPKGTIFSAGIVDADEEIRPNDIVFFKNDSFVGVGRALMSGEEMVEAAKGVAIEVKRKKVI